MIYTPGGCCLTALVLVVAFSVVGKTIVEYISYKVVLRMIIFICSIALHCWDLDS